MNNFWPVRVLRFVSVFFILSVCLGMYFYPEVTYIIQLRQAILLLTIF
jgi:hypothetical protein